MGQKLTPDRQRTSRIPYNFFGPKIAEVIDGVNDTSYNELLKNMGYRLLVPQMKLTSSKKSTQLTTNITNKGVAPLYRNWK